MAGTRSVLWLLWRSLFLVSFGCAGRDCRPSGVGDGAWDVNTSRTVAYKIQTQRTTATASAGTTDQSVQLVFTGAGQVDISIGGAPPMRYAMTADGVLIGKQPLASSFDLFHMVPNKTTLAQSNGSQTFSYPDDATRAAESNAVIYGSTITATVETTGPTVKARLSGTAALVPNAGLKHFLDSYIGIQPLPEVKQLLDNANASTPYLSGELQFDQGKGELVSANVDVVELPFAQGVVGKSSTVKINVARQ